MVSFVLSLMFFLQLTAAIVFLSFGVITSFMCLLVDGACIALNMVCYPNLKHCFSG